MRAAEIGRDASLRGAVDEPEPQQEWLVDVLDRVDLLRQDGRQRRDADRPAGELLDDRGEQLAVGRVEALVVDLHPAHRVARGRLVDRPSPWTWAWSRTRLSSRFTMRGVPRPRRAIARVAAASIGTSRIAAERSTISASSSSV